MRELELEVIISDFLLLWVFRRNILGFLFSYLKYIRVFYFLGIVFRIVNKVSKIFYILMGLYR